ncbi:MAG: dipeptide epimerase [Campylobacterota bacterium]
MKIVEIETEIKMIPLQTPFITALRRVENVEFVRVKVICDDGTLSFGEAPATKAITGEDLDTIEDTIHSNKEILLAQTPDRSLEILQALDIGSSAKAALNMAFYNIINPLPKTIKEYKTAITISLNEREKMLGDAKKALEDGLDILKLKFGSDIKHSIDVTKEIKKQYKDAKILVDANQAWSLQDTKEFIDAMQNVDIELIEQPVVADDLDALKSIVKYSNIPIAADESCFSIEDVKRVVERGCADIINIKLMKCGGVTNAIDILEFCKSKKIPVMFGSMLEGPISIRYAQYLVDIYSDVVKYIDLDSPLLYRREIK